MSATDGNATSGLTDPGEDGLAGRQHRLFGVAYHLLGSVADAEDVLQEVRQKLATADRSAIDDLDGWLVTVTARRSLDQLRSAARRREEYVGPWLPEPLVVDPAPDPAEQAAIADEVSFALLVVLEELSPRERVAFVLHDVFGEPFDHVAMLLGCSADAARQLGSRARRRVRERSAPEDDDPQRRWEVATAFMGAVAAGDLDAVIELLAPEVTLTSDGGGVAKAARNVVHGADRVARFFLGLARKEADAGHARPVLVNGGPGALLFIGEQLIGVLSADIREGRITDVRVVTNPEKLQHVR